MARCPGQDRSSWTADDIYEIECPCCGSQVEFFKDDARRLCPACGSRVANPRYDLGCAAWCAAADKCSIARGGTLVEPGGGEAGPAGSQA
jgi:hypothetical protein